MGKHSKISTWGYRGRHRAPSTAGRTAARVAATGAIAALPVTAASPAFASTPRVETVAMVSSGGFDHDQIARCESGGSASAQNRSSSASGLYQFIDSTWKAYGGSTARAKDASVSEQRRVAERAFAAEGYGPWAASKSCWGGKTGSGSKVTVTGEKRATPKTEKKVAPKVETKKVETKKTEQRVAKKHVAKKHVAKSRPKVKQQATGTHKVRAGETLSEITLERVGTSDWNKMYDANRNVIGANPHMITPGMVLKVVK